ncbi:MAG: oligopeptide/dipeptide ABC transporter ATP-binding protein [Eubacteriales bacterium]|nr:oligopeptide/dipeptide ABC transporter ATP-binding protein [Eubacteriales bacterium]
MILKNRSNRKESRKAFNRTMKLLLNAMNEAMSADKKSVKGLENAKKTKDFNTFEVLHLKLEGAYNKAHENAVTGLEDVEDFLFHIEKNAVENFSRNVRDIIRDAKFSVHKDVCPEVVNEYANQLRQAAIQVFRQKTKKKDYTACVEPLKKLKETFDEACKKEMPNYFAYAYYLSFGHGEKLPEGSVEELNKFLRQYLDGNFMLDFICDAKQGIVYSYNRSIEKKKAVIETLKEKRTVFIEGEPDKKVYKATAKELSAQVADSINKLDLVKDSAAYTFKESLSRTINTYFDSILSNVKEQKRFDKDQAKYDKLIARGKNPDYKVVPAKIVDLDIARHNIVAILDKLIDSYTKAVGAVNDFDGDAQTVAMIDFLKEKAQAVAYRVTHMVAKNKALKLMEEVGIPEPRKRYRQYPFQFSGGMRQRIVIAIALAANPDILICDEPTTALDVTIQAQILELINKIKKERNLSIIFITHDLGVVANMADRIAVMYAGKIVETGTAEDIFYSPAHPYTWALLSSMPDLDTNEKLEAIPGTPPNMIYPPKGDAFAARNKYAMKIDFEREPPMFKISETHSAATWLLHPSAPKVEMPKIVADRIARMKKLAKTNEKSDEQKEEAK